MKLAPAGVAILNFANSLLLVSSSGARARTAASFTSMPQPGALGSTSSPFSITGTEVTNSSRQATLSMSISMMRKFGTTAEKCALIMLHRWP